MNKKTDKNTTTYCQSKCNASCKPTCKKPQKDTKQETLDWVMSVLDVYLEKFTSTVIKRIERLESMVNVQKPKPDLSDICSSKQDEMIDEPTFENDDDDSIIEEEPVWVTIEFPGGKPHKIKLSRANQSALISQDGYLVQDDVPYDDLLQLMDLRTAVDKFSDEEALKILFDMFLDKKESDSKNPVPDIPVSNLEPTDFDILQEALQRKQNLKGFICIATPKS